MERVSRDELVWAGLLALGAVTFSTLPYLFAWWLTPPGYVFTGVLANPMDAFSYLAKIREAAEGAWLLHLPYTAEPHQGALVYPQYVALGKLVAVTGIPPIVAYQGARMLGGLLLLGVGYRLLASLIADMTVRRTAFMLLATSGGLTWITSFFGYLATDVTVPESNTFHSIFANGHFSLATALFLAVVCLAFEGFPRFAWLPMALGGVLNAALTLMQPFLLVTQAAVGGTWGVLLLLKGSLSRADIRPAPALLFLIPLPVAWVLVGQLYGDPVLSRWTAQNVTLSPPPWAYLAGYGLLAPLALAGLLPAWKRPETVGLSRQGALLIITWLGVGALLLYLPVPWQRRLSEGYHFPLCVMAAVGLHAAVLPRMEEKAKNLTRALRALTIGVCAIGSVFLAGTTVLGASITLEPYYLSSDNARALEWLQGHATGDDVVLASPTVSNLIPAWSDARVYWGHPFETVDAQAKLAQVQRFFRSDMPPHEACVFLQERGISLIYAGALEGRRGAVNWDALGLGTAYENGTVTMYHAKPCTG